MSRGFSIKQLAQSYQQSEAACTQREPPTTCCTTRPRGNAGYVYGQDPAKPARQGAAAVAVQRGKGGKPRAVFLGAKSRRAVLRYLRKRGSPEAGPLWVTVTGGRLTYSGLRQIVRRRAVAADVPVPSLHSFRRAFALACLRNGVDLVSLQRMLGHADLSVIRRYLAQTTEDLQEAHRKGGPVDRLL